MGANTKVEWCEHTFNPWRGCTKVSDGCKNCYADAQAKRNPGTLGVWGPNGTRVVAAESAWKEPLKWDKAAKAAGERHRVFCASMADVFEQWDGDMLNCLGKKLWLTESGFWMASHNEDKAPNPDVQPLHMRDVRQRLFRLIADTPNIDWLLLTKRPENAVDAVPFFSGTAIGGRIKDGLPHEHLVTGYACLPNVWIGTSVEDQAAADARIPHLLNVPAKVRFLSCEPLLGKVDLSRWLRHADPDCPSPDSVCPECGGDVACDGKKAMYRCVEHNGIFIGCGWEGDEAQGYDCGLHWVIVGGESGHHARPMQIAWAESLRSQCAVTSVSFFMKQLGGYPNKRHDIEDFPKSLQLREIPS